MKKAFLILSVLGVAITVITGSAKAGDWLECKKRQSANPDKKIDCSSLQKAQVVALPADSKFKN